METSADCVNMTVIEEEPGFPFELTDTKRGLMTVGGVRTSDIKPNLRRSQTAEETKSL